ncbi:restriction endonuclease subunit S [Aquimarina algiphila]|uniref:restriction endonuclease subunit S n=1 Tax=Aquimarina algiphila TaxID=2047982 RepID=UPI00249275D5|nr:restriction endonuclease subunit S [Aquimarina algiphila]
MNNVDFNEVVDFLEGPGVRKWQFTQNGVKLINIRNIVNSKIDLSNTDKHLSHEEVNDKYQHFLLKEGDFVMASSGATWGKIAEIGEEHLPLCLNTSIIRLKPKNEKLERRFLWHFIKSSLFTRQIDRLITGSAQPNFGPSHLNKISIPLPSPESQKYIISILDDAETLRISTAQLLKEYDLLAQSIFLEMFGDPVINPKSWEVQKLKELSTKIGSGNTPKGGSKVYVKKGIPFFRSQNVWRNNLLMNDIAFIDQATHTSMKKSSLKNGDILMTKTGRVNTENSSLGRAAMYLGEDDKANLNGHVYLIRLKKEVINEYLLFILTTNQYREYIRRVCVGGIDKRQLNKNHLEEFPIIYPPLKLQKEFTEKLALIEQQKELAKQELKESEDLFNCLLQKAFKGELV